MKYLVLKKCHAGGRICREGEIVNMDKIDNKYLKPLSAKESKAHKEPKREGSPLSSLNQQPNNAKTGMAAKREPEEVVEEVVPEKDDSKSEGKKEDGK